MHVMSPWSPPIWDRQFLSLSLSFMAMIVLKIIGLLFCRMSLNLHLFGICLLLNSVYVFMTSEIVPFSLYPRRRHMMLICPITDDVNFDP